MKFCKGFRKVAGEPIAFGAIGKALGRGLKGSASSTVGDAAKLKGLSHIGAATKASGGVKGALTTQAGRERLAEGVGKAAPSIAAAGGYGAGLKKVYNKLSDNQNQQTQYYQ